MKFIPYKLTTFDKVLRVSFSVFIWSSLTVFWPFNPSITFIFLLIVMFGVLFWSSLEEAVIPLINFSSIGGLFLILANQSGFLATDFPVEMIGSIACFLFFVISDCFAGEEHYHFVTRESRATILLTSHEDV